MRGRAALKSVPFLGSLRELDPICRKPKPGLFVELANRLRGPGRCWRDSPALLIIERLCALLDAAARRHEENQARYAAAFVAAHGAQDIGELSREETRELFAICLMGSRLDAEMRALKRLIRRCQ
jgi:hypothetical protein